MTMAEWLYKQMCEVFQFSTGKETEMFATSNTFHHNVCKH